MTMAGCYGLLLACDGESCGAGEFRFRATAEWNFETGRACRKAAKKAGWKMYPKTGLCLCPSCVRTGNKAVP